MTTSRDCLCSGRKTHTTPQDARAPIAGDLCRQTSQSTLKLPLLAHLHLKALNLTYDTDMEGSIFRNWWLRLGRNMVLVGLAYLQAYLITHSS
ncbi:hypothetical protein YC2023_089485 [Brassica napus]